jgi:Fe-S cluster assembly protein SufD
MIVTETNTYHDEHAKFCEEQSAAAPIWLQELRERGLSQFHELGLPTTRDEEWRFTNIAPVATHPFAIADVSAFSESQIDQLVQQAELDEDFHQLVFVNGRFAKQWSRLHDLPANVIVESLAESIDHRPDTVEDRLFGNGDVEQSAFVSLNTAFVDDGAYVSVPDGVSVDRPIHLIFLTVADTPTFCHPRNIVSLGKNSRTTVIESYLGCEGARYFTNTVTKLEVGESAELSHHKLQHEQPNALHVATTSVHQQTQSRFRSHYFSFGGDLTRNRLNCTLDGEGIECTLNGLYMPTGDQLMDCRTEIHHAKPNCNSYELYKGILDDRAKGVFNGKIHVYPDAQKTDAKQSNQTILLSDDAIIDTKPQLEIYADDVRCTHGATVGELDEKAIYYLRSRGIPADLARTMLIFAFANDVVQGVEVPAVRRHLESILLSERGLPNV